MRSRKYNLLRRGLGEGFTLLELLAVMAIILIMATIATTAYRGVLSGMGTGASISHLRQTLELARQSAILQGKSAYVVFYQDSTSCWYTTCLAEGYNELDNGFQIQDSYNVDLDNDMVGVTVFNLSEPDAVFSTVKQAENGVLTFNDSIWHDQDRYGWEVTKRIALPRGFKFETNTLQTVRFKPSGQAYTYDGAPFGGKKITLYEVIRSNRLYSIKINSSGLLETIYQ